MVFTPDANHLAAKSPHKRELCIAQIRLAATGPSVSQHHSDAQTHMVQQEVQGATHWGTLAKTLNLNLINPQLNLWGELTFYRKYRRQRNTLKGHHWVKTSNI